MKRELMLFTGTKDVFDKITATELYYDASVVGSIGRFSTEAVIDRDIVRIYFRLDVVTKKVV